MKSAILAALLFVSAPGVAESALRAASPHKVVIQNQTSVATDDAAQVKQLRAKLSKVSGGFTRMLAGKAPGSSAPFGETMVGAMMTKVETELQTVLAETEHEKDTKKALKQLQSANAAVKQMAKDIDSEQSQLMKEDAEQMQSLLLGVLMQKQKEPMSKQLEILNSKDFAKLPVVAAVLAAKDTKTPLFKQVAAYLDAHVAPQQADPKIPDQLKAGKDGKPDVTPIVLALEARLHKMVENEQRAQEHHQEEMMALDRTADEKKNSTKLVRHIESMKRKDTREFDKHAAMAKHDIKVLESAIESVKKGDMAGLAAAQDALDASMKAAQARAGHFLVLIQFMNRAEDRDCPYCVAQCVDKCHNDGKPYAACLTTCADAGK